MVNPAPGYSISTVYRKTGSWSCGYHTGVDLACPLGTRLVAAIDGQIRHRDYGNSLGEHQFAISPDPGQPFADGEAFYAHTRTRLADGVYVKAGDFVAECGTEGQSSGPHLHFEYHPNSKNNWGCEPICADPQPLIDHGGGGSAPPSGGPYVTEHVYSNKMGYGEPTNGDAESDSVKELRSRLDHISLVGGQTLGASPGVYDMEVDEEVRLWQEQVVHDNPDPPGQSYLGPNQFAAMFPSPPYTRHDAGLPAIASGGGSSGGGDGSGGSGGGGPSLPAAPALMLPNAIWNPITNFPGLRPFTGSAHKITLHTTETSAKPNWEAQQSGIPHLTVNLATGERWQHLDFNIAAYTLSGGDNSPNSASGQNIQIEMIGYTRDCPTWSNADYDELAQILHWLCDNLAIPYQFNWSFDSPVYRLDWNGWEPESGIFGHCHVPYNDHSDPTGLTLDLLLPPPPEPEPIPPGDYVTRAEFNDFMIHLATAFRVLADEIDPM